jgi:serine protease Do
MQVSLRSRVKVGLAAVAIAVTAGLGYSARDVIFAQQTQLPSPADLSQAFIAVAKKVKPAVVNIEVVERVRQSSSRRRFEGFPQIPGFPPFPDEPRRREGTGSGVIVSPEGYILTNRHVAGDADRITVKLADGRELRAKRIGMDDETDLAVIKVDAQDLPYARLGDSDRVEQGEWVLALGSPFGLQQTMTAGIVSATGRDLRLGTYDNYIQTDASINPGNSGGPLVNMQGEVVGINTLIYAPPQTGGNVGIGFAIPSNLAHKVYEQLVKAGKVSRGYLGVNLSPVTPAVAKAVGFTGTEGALVGDLAGDNVPAAKAGLRSGDVIIEFDGKPIKSPRQLTDLVAETPVGKTTELRYVRDGRVQMTTISLAERPPRQSARAFEEPGEDEPGAARLGIRGRTVTPEIARQLDLKIASGVAIESLQSDSPAAEAGLRHGDVIHRVNRTPVSSTDDLARALAALKGDKEVVLQIERSGTLAFVTVTLD